MTQADEPKDPRAPARLERVNARLDGGAFPRPPVLPVVAVLAFLLGLSLGFGLAPKGNSSAADASVSQVASALPTLPALITPPDQCHTGDGCLASEWPIAIVTPEPGTPAPVPAGGLSLTQAIKAAGVGWQPFADSDVLSAQMTTISTVSPDMEPSERWAWAITIKGGDVPCTGGAFPADSAPATLATCHVDSWTIMVDYFSGEVIEIYGGSLP